MMDVRFMKMKTFRSALLFGVATFALTLLLPLFCSERVLAQEVDPQPTDASPNDRMAGRGDGDLISKLNLTPDQVRQIREIRQKNAEEMRSSRQRMVRAQRSLDEAIYADSVDEAAIEAHARDLATAQAAVARLRALTELRIRRLLTPEQLNLLRNIRQQARERGRENQRGRRENTNAFQDRQRSNAPGSNNNVGRPRMDVKPPGATPPVSGKP
jgi:Spy/CpxP family protein refolding chaperone